MKFDEQFFKQDPTVVAKQILGKKLVRIAAGRQLEGVIAMTSAYKGEVKRKIKCLYNAPGETAFPTISGYRKFAIGTEEKGKASVITIDQVLADGKIISSSELCDYFQISKDDDGTAVYCGGLYIEAEGNNCSIEENMNGASGNCVGRYKLKL